jgi:hypothetical protein
VIATRKWKLYLGILRALPLGFAEEQCPVFAWATNSQEVLLLNTGSDTVVFIHLVRAALVRCHGTMCPVLTVFFSLLYAAITFLPKGVIKGF